MLRYLFLFSFIIFSLFGCKEEPNYKIPGSYHALQQLTHSRAYPFNDIPSDGFYKAFEHHEKLKDNENGKSVVEDWEAKGPLNTTGRTLTIAVNPQDPNTIYAGSASGGIWRSRSLGAGVSWEYLDTGFPVLGVSTIEFADQDSSVMFIGTGEVYNYEVTGNDGAYRATRGSYGIGILKSTDGGASWTKSLDWTYQNNHGVWMIEVSKSDPNIVYAATTEGIYKSIDQGENWDLVHNVIMATDISVNPQNPDDVIAVFGNFNSLGKGIYRTTDGGVTWRKSVENIPNSFNGKILIDRSTTDPARLYASIGNGFSGSEGATWLLRTDDNGKNWYEVNTLDYSKWQGWFAHDVAINPNNPDELIAIGIDIFKSTDGGFTLNQKSGGGVTLGTPEIGVPDGPPTYSHSDHHFVMYHPDLLGVVLFGNDGGVFISYDNGETFASHNGGMQTTQFYNGFSVDHSQADFAMGGLQDNSTSIFRGDGKWDRAIGGDGSWSAINQENSQIVFGSWQNLNILRSTNQGMNFAGVSINYPGNEFPLFIAPYIASPSNPDIMYAGGRYVYKSENTGITWNPVNNGQQLNGNPIYSMEVSPIDENVVYVGTSPQLNANTNIYPEVFVSTDGGSTWNGTNFDLPDRIPNDVTVDPQDPSIAYVCFSGFGTNHLYKTDDYGQSWIALDDLLPDAPGNAIIVDPFAPDHLYYGNDIGVYFSPDGGASWEVWTSGLPGAVIVMDLKISPFDQSIWVATHGNGTYKRPLEPVVLSNEETSLSTVEIKVFPNPCTNYINIEFIEPNDDSYTLQLYDTNGKLIINTQLNDYNSILAVDHLANGIYHLIVKGKDQFYKTKISKI